MFEDVFEELPWHLKEQAEQAIHERETKFPEGLPTQGDERYRNPNRRRAAPAERAERRLNMIEAINEALDIIAGAR